MRIKIHPAYIALAAVVLLAVLAVWVAGGKMAPPAKDHAAPGAAAPVANAGQQNTTPPPRSASPVAEGAEIDNRASKQPATQLTSAAAILDFIQRTMKQLAGRPLSGEQARALLDALRDAIFSADPQLAAQAILEFLHSGADEGTMLAFEVGPGGTLAGAPTVRVALLDWLGQLDVAAAEAYSWQWLNQPRNSGEWAMHMRNLAWADPDQSRSGRLVESLTWTLENTDWPQSAPPGFLDAFDLLPHTANAPLFSRFAGMAGDPNAGALPWAVFLAIDRTILKSPDRFLTSIAADSGLLAAAPEVRASLMARADIRSTPQREALQRYLRRTDLSPVEVDTFASLYPNYNLLVGYRLFTTADSNGNSMTEYAARDRAAFELLAVWEQDPSLSPAFRNALPRLRTRLAEHLASARRAEVSGELTDEP